jgi:hypothetical protein
MTYGWHQLFVSARRFVLVYSCTHVLVDSFAVLILWTSGLHPTFNPSYCSTNCTALHFYSGCPLPHVQNSYRSFIEVTPESADLAISTHSLERDPCPLCQAKAALRLLRKGGSYAVLTAG